MEDQKKKKPIPRKRVTLYLRELSVVVLGIVITLGATGLIGKLQEKKNTDQYLHAIRLELEENLGELQKSSEFYERNFRLSQLLSTYGIDDAPQDSLALYNDVYGQFFTLAFNTNAFDMMKASGAMRLIKDKELLQSIWGCYSLLNQVQINSNNYMEKKLTETFRAVQESGTPRIDDMSNPHHRKLVSFYSIGWGITPLIDTCSKKIEETLMMY